MSRKRRARCLNEAEQAHKKNSLDRLQPAAQLWSCQCQPYLPWADGYGCEQASQLLPLTKGLHRATLNRGWITPNAPSTRLVPVSYPILRRASRQGAGADAVFGFEAPACAVLRIELGSCKFYEEGCIVTGASLRYPQPRGLHAGLVKVQGTAFVRHSSAPIALHQAFGASWRLPSVCCTKSYQA
jgi:hypothetical protein